MGYYKVLKTSIPSATHPYWGGKNNKYPYLFCRFYSPFNKISHFHYSSLQKNIQPILDNVPTPTNIIENKKLAPRPILIKKPLETYENSMLAKTIAYKKYAGKAIIYVWFNKITGGYYVGSSYGKSRLEDYFKPWYLKKGYVVCKSILEYGHENHMLIIMEELGNISKYTKHELFAVEQIYIDWNFKENKELCMNRQPFAHGGKVIISKRIGKNNPMYGRTKSPEFLYWQNKDRFRENNPQWGVKKSAETLEKLRQKVYVYDSVTGVLSFPFFESKKICAKSLNIGHTTLNKYLKNGLPYKGMIFSRNPKE